MRFVIAGLVLALGLVACNDDTEAFCDKGTEIAERLESGDFDPTNPDDVGAFADEMHELAADAPDEIEDEVDTIADGLEKLSEGDISAAQDPEFQPALERFGEYAENEC